MIDDQSRKMRTRLYVGFCPREMQLNVSLSTARIAFDATKLRRINWT